MKRICFFFIFTLAIQFGSTVALVSAEQKGDKAAVNNVIESYFDNFNKKDSEALFNLISVDYFDDTEGKITNYADFKDIVEKFLLLLSMKYTDYKRENIEVSELNITDNEAKANVAFTWEGNNQKTGKRESGQDGKAFFLNKEYGGWKIIGIRRISLPQEIEEVVKRYFDSFRLEDLEVALDQLSPKFKTYSNGKLIDYAEFKLIRKQTAEDLSKKYISFGQSDFKITSFNVKKNQATLEFQFKWEGYNLETSKNESGSGKKSVELIKENNVWKITRLTRLPAGY